jgi:carbon-monoxide dehydrogenase medium subunit
MYTKPFGYERADTMTEACGILRAHRGAARAISGGQSLLPMMNLGLLELELVVDLSRIEEGRGVTESEGYLSIGALCRHRQLEHDPLVVAGQPLLAAAAGWIGSPRIRNVGTLGGSLAHSDPAAELPLVMIALGAEYVLTDGRTTRNISSDEFHLGYFTSALADDELVSAVRVPTLGPGWGWGFTEMARRKGDFAVVAAAALVRIAGGRVIEARLAIGGVGSRPLRLGAVEAGLSGATLDTIDRRVGPVGGIEPFTDTNATADYRRHLARVLSVRALTEAAGRAEATSA